MNKQNIKDLCTFIRDNKATMYPIENQMLLEATDYIVNGYLKMLAVILQQADEISEPQLFLYKRIVAGIVTDKTTEDYLRMALLIELEDFYKFTLEMRNLDSKYRFIFDAILLSCVSGKQDEQLELVAEFSEALEIRKIELQYLATMARCLLRKNPSDFVEADEIKPESIPNNFFDGYVKLLSNSCILSNGNRTILQPSYIEEIDIKKISIITNATTPQIKLHSVKMDIKEYPLLFKKHKKVIIDGCEFLNGEKCLVNSVITFEECEEIIITNSVFRNFKGRPIKISAACSVKILNTCFENCYHEFGAATDDWRALGAVIRVENMLSNNPIIIDGCIFDKCGGKNSENWYRSQFICNYIAEVNNTSFDNCWHYNCNSNIDPENSARTMFAKNSKSLNCNFNNCANFCE